MGMNSPGVRSEPLRVPSDERGRVEQRTPVWITTPPYMRERRGGLTLGAASCEALAGGLLERLSVLPDGRVAYRVKYAGRGGTHRVMTKVEFLARLAALVAPPRYPLVRYHGVLAPHSKWPSAVVPRPPSA